MDKLPGALVVSMCDEATALKEARKLGIPTICLIDTDGDPELADIPIPGNDDSMRSIDVVIRELCLAAPRASRCARARTRRRPAPPTAGRAPGARASSVRAAAAARRSTRHPPRAVRPRRIE
jgi:small subunit ribosomal protein S2